MAEFHGYRCDSCGNVIEDSSQRTRKRVRFEGPILEGDFVQDLCNDCTPSPDDLPGLRPIPRRKSRKKREAHDQDAVGSAA